MTETPLDRAHARMAADDEDEAARRAFFAALAGTELFVALDAPPEGDRLKPLVLEVDGAQVVLAFDTEARLADFLPGGAPYAGIPGRTLAGMLAGQGVMLGVNLDVAPSAILIDAAGIGWLSAAGGSAAAARRGALDGLRPPANLPPGLLPVLTERLRLLEGLASRVWLAAAEDGLVLAVEDAPAAAAPAIGQAMAEAASFAGLPDGALDVAFLASGDPVSRDLERVGIALAVPQPQAERRRPAMPGGDPRKPPRLV